MKVWAELKDADDGCTAVFPPVRITKLAAAVPVPNRSDVIVTSEVVVSPEMAPMVVTFEADVVEKSNPFTPKLRSMAPPLARNWNPSARSIARAEVFAELTSTFKSPDPETINREVFPVGC